MRQKVERCQETPALAAEVKLLYIAPSTWPLAPCIPYDRHGVYEGM